MAPNVLYSILMTGVRTVYLDELLYFSKVQWFPIACLWSYVVDFIIKLLVVRKLWLVQSSLKCVLEYR